MVPTIAAFAAFMLTMLAIAVMCRRVDHRVEDRLSNLDGRVRSGHRPDFAEIRGNERCRDLSDYDTALGTHTLGEVHR